MIALKRTTDPTEQPVLLEELKDHLRIDGADDDAYLHSLIYGATARFEDDTHRAVCTQTWTYNLDRFPSGDTLWLYRPPLASVTSVKYTPNGGIAQTFDSDSYIVDTASEPARIVLNDGYSWPSSTLQAANGVEVIYVCGMAREDVPDLWRQAIKFLAAHWYENRESTTDVRTNPVTQTYESIVESIKVHWP
jgi:uncharacterized phiE125 gp8 family phage protein